jgi:hypothetical protein
MPCRVLEIYDRDPGHQRVRRGRKSTGRVAKGKKKKEKRNRNMPTPQSPTVVRSVVKRSRKAQNAMVETPRLPPIRKQR